MKLRTYVLGLATALGLLVAGCGGSKEAATDSRFVWPQPPDTARVAYVRTLKGEDDFSGGLGGVVSAIAGKKAIVKFERPFDVCTAGEGRVYVTDAMQGLILYDTKEQTVEPIGAKIGFELKDPRGIAYGRHRLFAGVAGMGQVIIIDDGGNYVGRIGRADQFKNPVDIALDTSRSRVYIVDNRLHQVLVYSEKGDSLFAIGRRGTGDGEFNFPQGIALDKAGNVYIVDSFNYRVEVFDTNGTFLRTFGKQGDAYGTFARPKGIAIDTYDNIYVLDGMHNNFQIFNNGGELLMFVGRYSTGNDGFQNPVSIAIDSRNTMYVTDNINGRVQVFQLLSGN